MQKYYNHIYNNKYHTFMELYDDSNNLITTFEEFYDFMERILVDITNNLMKYSLQQMSKYKYNIIGGKAINTYISEKSNISDQ